MRSVMVIHEHKVCEEYYCKEMCVLPSRWPRGFRLSAASIAADGGSSQLSKCTTAVSRAQAIILVMRTQMLDFFVLDISLKIVKLFVVASHEEVD